MVRVAEVAACAEVAFEVVERVTVAVESSLVVRELAVADMARGLLVIELASFIRFPLESGGREFLP